MAKNHESNDEFQSATLKEAAILGLGKGGTRKQIQKITKLPFINEKLKKMAFGPELPEILITFVTAGNYNKLFKLLKVYRDIYILGFKW